MDTEPGPQELRIAAMLDALDEEHARVREAMLALKATSASLQRDVKGAAAVAVQDALKALRGELASAQQVVVDLQRLSLWRAALQHGAVALVSIGITLLAIWLYVPSPGELAALRAEKAQLQAAIVDLEQRGARLQHSLCGAPADRKRFCVLVPKGASLWEDPKNKAQAYVVPVGY